MSSACCGYPMGKSRSMHTHTHVKPILWLMGMGTISCGYGYLLVRLWPHTGISVKWFHVAVIQGTIWGLLEGCRVCCSFWWWPRLMLYGPFTCPDTSHTQRLIDHNKRARAVRSCLWMDCKASLSYKYDQNSCMKSIRRSEPSMFSGKGHISKLYIKKQMGIFTYVF